ALRIQRIEAAVELTGRPDIVKQQDIDDFVEHQKTSRGEDITYGTCSSLPAPSTGCWA
ncbi:hypothetical protein F443_05108, partial [Phytophthora nicotianae P1569]